MHYLRKMNHFLLVVCLLPTFFSSLYAKEAYYDFNMAWDKALPTDISLENLISSSIAGSHGFLRPDKENVVFQDSNDFRAWGIGIRITDKFPPQEPEEMKRTVDRIASFGFNHLRIYGLDFNKPGVFNEWSRTGQILKEPMDRICRFINYAKSRGIYYSMSVNHNPLRYNQKLLAVKKNRKKLWHTYKTKQLLDSNLINQTKDWVRTIYSYNKGECKTSFATDPANIYFDAVNEASIFNSFSKNFDDIDESSKKTLNSKFRSWLLKKYKTEQNFHKNWPLTTSLSSIKITGKKGLKKKTANIKVDTIAFLVDFERQYSKELIDTVRNIGFKGLTSTTNHWYGDGSLLASDVADVIEIHAYFDRPRRAKDIDGWLLNVSYLEEFDTSPIKRWNYKRNPLNLLFESSIKDKPLIVTEWNHGAWSDYVYEGPVMIMFYASYQNFPIINIHTYQESRGPFKKGYNNSGFSFNGNPVLIALQPSLALAFLRKDIPEAKRGVQSTDFLNKTSALHAIANSGDHFTKGKNKRPSVNGFFSKHRRTIYSNNSNEANNPPILFEHQELKEQRFVIDEHKFKAIIGDLSSTKKWANYPKINFSGKGAITVVSLDNLPLSDSNKTLITISGRYTRSDRRSSSGGLFSKSKKEISIAGESTVMLEALQGRIILPEKSSGKKPILFALFPTGERKEIKSRKISKDKGINEYEFKFLTNTPWYIVKY